MKFYFNIYIIALSSLAVVGVVYGQGQGGQGPPEGMGPDGGNMGNGGGGNMGMGMANGQPQGDNPICYVCGLGGEDGTTILKPTVAPNTKITLPGVDRNNDGMDDEVTCITLARTGANGMIPADNCDALSQLVQASCACDVVEGNMGQGMGQGGGMNRRPGNRQDVLARMKTPKCKECHEEMKAINQCYRDNQDTCATGLRECHQQAKQDGLTRIEALETCICEPCSDLIQDVTTCISDNCVPTCVQETTRAYYKCASKPRYGCKELCQDTIEQIKSEVLANYEEEDVKLRDALFNLEVVQKVQEENLDLTCENISDKFYATPACTLGNCCPYCVDEFEDMAACAVNTVVAFEENEANGITTEGDDAALDADDIGCTFDCGDNIEFVREDGVDGDGMGPGNGDGLGGPPADGGDGDDPTAQTRGGNNRRRTRTLALALDRILQETDVVEEVPEVVETKFSMCSDSMSRALAVGESASAADNFLNCAMEASLPNLPDGEEEGDNETNSSATAGGTYTPGFVGVSIFAAMLLNMLL